jgi:hypothetical protein
MAVLLVAGGLVLLALAIVGVGRARSGFDDMTSPADDLRRADDGYQPGLAERDGTGGFL